MWRESQSKWEEAERHKSEEMQRERERIDRMPLILCRRKEGRRWVAGSGRWTCRRYYDRLEEGKGRSFSGWGWGQGHKESLCEGERDENCSHASPSLRLSVSPPSASGSREELWSSVKKLILSWQNDTAATKTVHNTRCTLKVYVTDSETAKPQIFHNRIFVNIFFSLFPIRLK